MSTGIRRWVFASVLVSAVVASLGAWRAAWADTPSDPATTAAAPAPARVEYKVVELKTPFGLMLQFKPEGMEKLLNRQTKDGWRLISVDHDGKQYVGVFERSL